MGNVLLLRSVLSGATLLRQLNGIGKELSFTAAAPAPEGFRVRAARRRIYRYFQPGLENRLPVWQRAARLFAGTVDVRSLGRGLPASVPCWRTVEAVEVSAIEGGLRLEVRAPSFVWGMVRKIVGAIREHDAGRLPLPRLESTLRGSERITLPLAEPEGLVLWAVEYPFPWTILWRGPNRHQLAWAQREREAAWVRSHVRAVLTRWGDDGSEPVDGSRYRAGTTDPGGAR